MKEKAVAIIEKARQNTYIQKISTISALLGIFAWLVAGLLTEQIVISFFYGCIFAAACFGVLLYLPKARKKIIAAEIEASIPFALMAIASELNMNISFEKCIENAAKSSHGRASEELSQILRENREKGMPLQKCFFSFAERSGSLAVKRCIAQLNNALEQGKKKNSGEPIKRIAREMLSRQKAESKEFSGKLAVYSLLFIAVSAIVPALFQSFVIVGSMVLSIGFSPMQVLFVIALLFPALDVVVLLYIRSKTPVFLRD